LRLLTALCGDALSCAPMRAVINERETSMATLHTERLKEVSAIRLDTHIMPETSAVIAVIESMCL